MKSMFALISITTAIAFVASSPGCGTNPKTSRPDSSGDVAQAVQPPQDAINTQFEAMIESRDRLLTRNHFRGRGFSSVKMGIDGLVGLYRRAGEFGYQNELTPEQRRSLMLLQLETISLAMNLERFYSANMGRLGDRGVEDEAVSFARFAVSEYPDQWPRYEPPRVTIAEGKRLRAQAARFQGTRNALFDDPAVMARASVVFIARGSEVGGDLLVDAIEKMPNDIHVRAVGALMADPGSDLQKQLLEDLPSNFEREVGVLRSVMDRTRRSTEFWTTAQNVIVEVVRRRFAYEAELRANGICTTCEGGGRVSRTRTVVNGYSTPIAASSRVIDCPICSGTGRR